MTCRDVRDRCILRLHEVDEMKAPYDPAGHSSPVPDPTLANSGTGRLLAPTYPANNGSWNDLSYFSEPEFDSGYRHQHIHTKPAAATQQRVSISHLSQLVIFLKIIHDIFQHLFMLLPLKIANSWHTVNLH